MSHCHSPGLDIACRQRDSRLPNCTSRWHKSSTSTPTYPVMRDDSISCPRSSNNKISERWPNAGQTLASVCRRSTSTDPCSFGFMFTRLALLFLNQQHIAVSRCALEGGYKIYWKLIRISSLFSAIWYNPDIAPPQHHRPGTLQMAVTAHLKMSQLLLFDFVYALHWVNYFDSKDRSG